MKNNLIMSLIMTTVCGAALADDSYGQLISQTQNIEQRVAELEREGAQVKSSIAELLKQSGKHASDTKALQKHLTQLTAQLGSLERNQASLEGKQASLVEEQAAISESLDQLGSKTTQRVQIIDETITERSKWYGAAIAAIILLLGGCYWFLRRRNDASEQALSTQVKFVMETVRSTEEKIAKADMELADSLLEILNKLKVTEMSAETNGQKGSIETDHHLPLKLADEIHRMRKRLESLPKDTKGLTPLQKSLERLESELGERGYEIVDHAGMIYTDNLSVKARFIPSDDLNPDEKIISKVVVPQVNYDGVMIRMADIEVSIGS